LLAAALSADVGWSELASLVDPLAIHDAVQAGLIVVDRSRVRPSHPLLGAAARRHSSTRERRELHLALAAAIDDPTLQARHRALATAGEDPALATEMAAASDVVAERGAALEAEEFAAEALRLTPRRDSAYPDRLLRLARCHLAAGDAKRANALLTGRLGELPAGPARAMAHLVLGEASDLEVHEAQLELALAEASEDQGILAAALIQRSMLLAFFRVAQLNEAEALARAARSAAESVGAREQEQAGRALAWIMVLRGRPISDLGQFGSLPGPRAGRLAFRGEVSQARAALSQMLLRAAELGDVRGGLAISMRLCELELRVGNPAGAAKVLAELGEWTEMPEMRIARARLHSLLAAVTGLPAEATRRAEIVTQAAPADCPMFDRLEATRALGLVALLQDDWEAAAGLLRAVWEHTVSEGIDDPGAFPVAADLVESFVLVNDTAAARKVSERLRHLAVDQQHPWGLITLQRCEAAIQLVADNGDDPGAALLDAAAAYGRLGLGFDRARTLLFLGRALRRAGKRATARQALEAAETTFAELGCTGWAAAAGAELTRVSGRRSAGSNELTASEQRVVELAKYGLSNKQIAAQLFVSVYTVEAHLSHAYAKLGVRSRSQLIRLATGVPDLSSRP
jgi:DNA-binding CsgD family transcriptional regulator